MKIKKMHVFNRAGRVWEEEEGEEEGRGAALGGRRLGPTVPG